MSITWNKVKKYFDESEVCPGCGVAHFHTIKDGYSFIIEGREIDTVEVNSEDITFVSNEMGEFIVVESANEELYDSQLLLNSSMVIMRGASA